MTGFGAFQLASRYSGDGAFEVAAIALNFYLLGRSAMGRAGILVSAGVFVYWLPGRARSRTASPAGRSARCSRHGSCSVDCRSRSGARSTSPERVDARARGRAARLEGEQEARARAAAAEERNRMARELHDVIAHNVSVMVIQTSAAQRVARSDLEAAREALAGC